MRRMISRRAFLAAMASCAAASALAACGGAGAGSGSAGQSAESALQGEAKPVVTIALWANQLLENYAPWLQQRFPDVYLDFYVANNSADYYKFRAAHNDLPDIMTLRRFSLRDVEPLKDELLDLGDTKLANTFYQSYLRNYTYDDGVVNWLPACAELDDLIVNKTLFEQNDIPLPTDYESFVSACRQFEQLGLRGYISDFYQDYTCMETLQGLSIAQLATAEGRQWRSLYESGAVDGLDEEVWLPVFEKMQDFITRVGLDASAIEVSTSDILQSFDRGEIAVYRGTGANLVAWGADYERAMIPYPGDTEEESWYLTYPSFQLAAHISAGATEERQELILSIMDAMLGEEGLRHISDGQNMIAYNKGVELEMAPEFGSLQPYIDNNRIYIRLASSDMFSVSKDVVQKMLRGELADARAAYEEFDRQMREPEDTAGEAAVHIAAGYSRSFVNGRGNEAASALYNSMREDLGVELVMGQAANASGSILAGDYTENELSYLVGSWTVGPLILLRRTGREITELVQYMLSVKGTRDSVTNESTLPAASGFEMTLSQGEDGDYQLQRLTVNGEAMDMDKTWTLVMSINSNLDLKKFNENVTTDYELLDATIRDLLLERLLGGRQLSEPTPYVTIV